MSEQIAKNINNKVKIDDDLIIAGDFSFGGKDKIIKARSMINCKNIYLVLGNHCYEIIKKDLKYLFTKTWGELDVSCIVKFVIGGKKYVVSHYSLKVWEDSHKGVRNLYSHSHGTLPDDINSLSFDVGMDANNLQPLSFIEVEEIISKKTWKAIDHHNEQIKE
jgi:calcineurin-like phosphoesterase family protein